MLRMALGRSGLDTCPASLAITLAPHSPRAWQAVSDDVSSQQSSRRALVRVPWQLAVASLLEGNTHSGHQPLPRESTPQGSQARGL